MKNHFFISYAGNKRQEVHKIYEHLDLNKINAIIEPFCGTSALSFYIASLHPKKFKYILNDYDNNLIQLYKICLDEEAFKILCNELNEDYSKINTKDEYLEYIRRDNLKAYIIKNKIYKIRPGLFPIKRINTDFKYLLDCPIVQFLRTEHIEFLNEDGYKIYKQYNNDKHNLILLDPPYLESCNSYYKLNPSLNNIYEDLSINSIKKQKAKIICILENNWIIRLLFRDCEFINYDKKYENYKHKKTIHSIIKNF